MSNRGEYLSIDELPADWRNYCLLKRPELDADAVWEDFSDYWQAASGQMARKRNWLATWRMWVRRTRAPESAKPTWQQHAADNGLDARPGETEWQWKTRVENHMRGH